MGFQQFSLKKSCTVDMVWASMIAPQPFSFNVLYINIVLFQHFSLSSGVCFFVALLVRYVMFGCKHIWNKLTNYISAETAGVIFPTIFLMICAVPSFIALFTIERRILDDFSIKITGNQWFWDYDFSQFELKYNSFMENKESFLSKGFSSLNHIASEFHSYSSYLWRVAKPALIPIDILSQILGTAADVIHSWSVESVLGKFDVSPGRLNVAGFFAELPGMAFGSCREICGANHSFIPISVVVQDLTHISQNFSVPVDPVLIDPAPHDVIIDPDLPVGQTPRLPDPQQPLPRDPLPRTPDPDYPSNFQKLKNCLLGKEEPLIGDEANFLVWKTIEYLGPFLLFGAVHVCISYLNHIHYERMQAWTAWDNVLHAEALRAKYEYNRAIFERWWFVPKFILNRFKYDDHQWLIRSQALEARRAAAAAARLAQATLQEQAALRADLEAQVENIARGLVAEADAQARHIPENGNGGPEND